MTPTTTPGPISIGPAPAMPAKRAWIGLALVALAVLAAALFIGNRIHRKLDEAANGSQRLTACKGNLARLGADLADDAKRQAPSARRWSGPALWISLRRLGGPVRRGDERLYLCPGDTEAGDPPETDEERDAWDRVDLDRVPRELCSYAGRDFEHFPLESRPLVRNVLGACVQHRDGAVVVYDDGDVDLLGPQELGLGPDDEMTVGPESKSPVLRVLRFGDGSVR